MGFGYGQSGALRVSCWGFGVQTFGTARVFGLSGAEGGFRV